MTHPVLRIGTRASPLALAQADLVRRRLLDAHPDLAQEGAVEIVPMRTTGDQIQDRTLAEIGGKGLFTKELEEALKDGALDLAVHSAKDMPTRLPNGLTLGCFLEREDARDALIAGDVTDIGMLPPGTVVGTASLRRSALLLHRRPDLKVVPLRGNVDTRLRKRAEGVVQATILAMAGLKRLGRVSVGHPIAPEDMLPAVGQGAICVEHRSRDSRVMALLAPINHRNTALAVAAEQAMLAVLDGSCRTPIGGYAVIEHGTLWLRALIARPDGTQVHATERRGAPVDGVKLGRDAAHELRKRGGPDFFIS